jgi:hypothetical protein
MLLQTYNFAKTPFNAAKAPLVMARMIQGDVEEGEVDWGVEVDIAADEI